MLRRRLAERREQPGEQRTTTNRAAATPRSQRATRGWLRYDCRWLVESLVLGLRRRDTGLDARHDRERHDLPASSPGTPGTDAASRRQPLLPVLALAHDRHGDARVDRDPPQAPRPLRNEGRPA